MKGLCKEEGENETDGKPLKKNQRIRGWRIRTQCVLTHTRWSWKGESERVKGNMWMCVAIFKIAVKGEMQVVIAGKSKQMEKT